MWEGRSWLLYATLQFTAEVTLWGYLSWLGECGTSHPMLSRVLGGVEFGIYMILLVACYLSTLCYAHGSRDVNGGLVLADWWTFRSPPPHFILGYSASLFYPIYCLEHTLSTIPPIEV